ncbi:MAG TPA: cytidine deaminase [Candidatus Hydrothermia bacterium]|nr:cytidine deaminase [Candidatus Hydrothermae bacterium]MDD3648870.1 cytidine deaminase [Candidatus Hydrothermia bacterium]MDD5572728.1 cytidine deaminase [Candidatus Hydrothermia bacterium]HOK23111.1 cytidine deaminase [Candidatus Hydrothermia bacterium]HOL23815.1 cytidine deaminase [Candidatus Hydrothermia bacterium]
MLCGEIEELVKKAEDALKNAYAPYSNYRVSAALLCEDGSVYTGVNVENSSYGLSICAERVAVFKAVSEGQRKFKAIAIVSDSPNIPPLPCGACRQVLAEFSKDTLVVVKTPEGLFKGELKDLLPYSFDFTK